MRVLSRPEVGTEVRAWFSKVFGVCRSDWEAPLPLRGGEREGYFSQLQRTDLAVYLLEVTQRRSWGIGEGLKTFCE